MQCCVTSPPYLGLRDYQTGEWEGGVADHQHDTVGARGEEEAPEALGNRRPGLVRHYYRLRHALVARCALTFRLGWRNLPTSI